MFTSASFLASFIAAFPQTKTETPFSAACLNTALEPFPIPLPISAVAIPRPGKSTRSNTKERLTSFLRTSSIRPPNQSGPPPFCIPTTPREIFWKSGRVASRKTSAAPDSRMPTTPASSSTPPHHTLIHFTCVIRSALQLEIPFLHLCSCLSFRQETGERTAPAARHAAPPYQSMHSRTTVAP